MKLQTNDNQPITGIPVDVYASTNLESPLFRAVTDAEGRITGTINAPAYVDTLIIDPAYVGLNRNAVAVLKNNSVTGVIGGRAGISGDFIATLPASTDQVSFTASAARTTAATVYTFPAYNALGKPTVLETPDVVSASLLSRINTSLPEAKPVSAHHPNYLDDRNETSLNLVKQSDVWVTFIHEGASFTNTLAYYTYPTHQPPQTAADIDTIRIVFPNASLLNSGGELTVGTKVKLGRFPAGTSIGFVVLMNAWRTSTGLVNTTVSKWFSDDVLNVEANPALKRHALLLEDKDTKVFVQGFEDKSRSATVSPSDHDFNDLMFYATSNPVDGISPDGVPPTGTPTDCDKDGVPDHLDKFPCDPDRAYITYFPTQYTWGTHAFEDLWPYAGDYDLNDLVLGYHYTMINNASNSTVEMYGKYAIRGVGATFKNGLGVQLPVAANQVSSITGQRFLGSYVTRNANGTEAGQSQAVFFPFDHTGALINPATYVNNLNNGKRTVQSDTANVFISFASPVTQAELGSQAPFNPFVVIDQQRGREVHFPGYHPTDKADTRLLGSGHDRTNPATNKYYVTANNWPWGINFVETFDYPTEKSHIGTVYTHFLSWVASGGTLYADWYKPLPGYRNESLIYKRN
ncbi:LruC domain-containing protein [Paraflavisolibacter sp. H34]